MNVKKKKILTVGAFAAIAAAVYAVVLFMNYYTPLTVDDFCYHTNFATKEMLSGLSSIVESMRFHYHYTNGRIIPHTIVQLLAYYAGKDVFNFINAAVFTALGFLIYKISNYKKPSSPVRFLFIYVLLFLFVPAFGQTALWFDGSVNYLWGTAAAATLLYFFHTKLISPEKYTSKLFFALSIPLAFLAGGWSENTSAVLWMLEVLYGCLYLWTYRKKLPLFYIADFVVSTASWLIMITAPANAYRKAKFPNAGPIETLRSGMNNCMFMMRRYLYAFLFMMLLLLILAVFKKASDNRFTRKYEVEFDKLRVFTSFLFLLGSLTANFVMAVAPYAPRSGFGPIIYMMISLCMLASCFKMKKFSWIAFATGAVIFVCVGAFVLGGMKSIKRFDIETERIRAGIAADVAAGEKDVRADAVFLPSEFIANTGLENLTANPKHYINRDMATYYGAETLVVDGFVKIEATRIERAKSLIFYWLFG